MNIKKQVCHIRKAPSSKDIIAARKALGMTQLELANTIGASIRTVQAWEQDINKPSGISKTLLGMVKANPKVALDLIRKAA